VVIFDVLVDEVEVVVVVVVDVLVDEVEVVVVVDVLVDVQTTTKINQKKNILEKNARSILLLISIQLNGRNKVQTRYINRSSTRCFYTHFYEIIEKGVIDKTNTSFARFIDAIVLCKLLSACFFVIYKLKYLHLTY
jgi:hypothetical protein